VIGECLILQPGAQYFKGVAWNNENEIKELSSFDIGIMPFAK